ESHATDGPNHTALVLRRPPALDAGGESREIESRGGETGIARTVLDESIGNADLQHRYLDTRGGARLGDRGTGAPHDGVFLDGDDGPVPLRHALDQGCIERFDEAHVDQRGV